jgi:P-type Ca2+ transporter type 2C
LTRVSGRRPEELRRAWGLTSAEATRRLAEEGGNELPAGHTPRLLAIALGVLAVHVPIAGMGLVPVLFGWPLFLFPVHVVFLEFVLDPACSLVFEAERSDKDVMQRPPRDPREPLFTRAMLAESVLLGFSVFVAVAAVFGTGLVMAGESQARAMGFITLVVANVLLILANRSHRESLATILARPNRMFWTIAALAIAGVALAAFQPSVAAVFRFEPPSPIGVLASVSTAIVAVVWIEATKLVRRRRHAFQ